MTAPTRAQVQTMWQDAVDLLQEAQKFGRSNSKNVIGMIQTLTSDLITDYGDEIQAAVNGLRGLANGMIAPQTARAILRPIVREYCRSVIGRSNLTSDTEMFDELYKYFIDNTLRVQGRNITFGSPTAAGSNVGNSQILRLNVDEYNFPIENQHVDSKRALCVLDYQTRTGLGNEAWEFAGQVPGRDELQRSGSGLKQILRGSTSDDSILLNAGFENFGGTAAAPTSLTNWTSLNGDSSTYYTLDSTDVFRTPPSVGTGTDYTLEIQATNRFTQKISLQQAKLDTKTPYLLAGIWNRAAGSGSGTLVFRMGSVATSVAVSAQTGWNVTLVPSVVGQSCWYRMFQQNDLQVQIDWTRTSGTINVAEMLFLPGQRFNNSWYWIIPASAASFTAHRYLDSFTWADIVPSDSKIQRWNWIAFDRYLASSVGSSITFADP